MARYAEKNETLSAKRPKRKANGITKRWFNKLTHDSLVARWLEGNSS